MVAAVALPKYTSAATDAREASALTKLRWIRTQIEVYNGRNPDTVFTPFHSPKGRGGGRGRGWDPTLCWSQLKDAGLLREDPKNPAQNGATSVWRTPSHYTGWVWNDPENDGTYNIYGVGVDGKYLDVDQDGVPD